MATREEVAQIFPLMAAHFLPEKAEGITANIQFELTGENGGLYWLRIAANKCEAGEGKVDNPKMTLKADADDYVAMINGTLNPMQAFMSGKIKIQGDMGLALKLQTMFATS